MIDFTSMATWMLILYGAISAAIALLLYDVADILSTKEKRQRFKRNVLIAFNIFKNPRHKKDNKDTK